MSLPDEFADAFGAFAGVRTTTPEPAPVSGPDVVAGAPGAEWPPAGQGPDAVAGAPRTEGPAAGRGRDVLADAAAEPAAARGGGLAVPPAPRMGPDAEGLPALDRPDLPDLGAGAGPADVRDLRLLSEVQVELAVELGRVKLPLRELLALGPGAVLELDRPADAPVDVLVNGCLVARGEVVVIDGEFGVRVTAVVQRA